MQKQKAVCLTSMKFLTINEYLDKGWTVVHYEIDSAGDHCFILLSPKKPIEPPNEIMGGM